MDYVIVFALGMLAATLLIRWMARRAIDQLMEKFTGVVEEKIEESQLRVNLEFDQNIYFLYNSDDGSFIAQGNNLQELKTHLQQRFPNRIITIVNGDKTAIENLKLQIKELNEDSNSIRSTP